MIWFFIFRSPDEKLKFHRMKKYGVINMMKIFFDHRILKIIFLFFLASIFIILKTRDNKKITQAYPLTIPNNHYESESFSITNDVLASGGGLRYSTSFRIGDTVGQAAGFNPISSNNFKINSGYWQPTYDITSPIARIDSPADQATIRSLSFRVDWSATDPAPGSGIDDYQIQFKIDAGDWTDWYTTTKLTSSQFGPISPILVQYDHSYSFRVRATDILGNQGDFSDETLVLVTRYSTFLPLILNNFSSFTNGGFELGWSGWQQGGVLDRYINSSVIHSASSEFSAQLGSDYKCDRVPVGSAWIEQTFTIPQTGINRILISYKIYSRDESYQDEYDRFEIWIDNELVKWDGDFDGKWGCKSLSTNEWKSFEYIFPESKKGENAILRIVNKSQPDGGNGYTDFPTWVFVDDIQLLP